MKHLHTCLNTTLAAALVLASFVARSDEPAQSARAKSRTPATTANYGGTYGDVILEGDAALPTAGIVLRAGSRPTVAARTGSASADSGFVVFNSNDTELLRVRGDGRIGIGNSDPTETLTVGSGATHGDISIRSSTQNALQLGTFYDHAALALNRRVRDGTFVKPGLPTASVALYSASANSVIAFNTANANGVSDTERMRIDKDGNVGIGTWTPSAHLHVNGGMRPLRLDSANSGGFGILFRDVRELLPTGSGVVMDMLGNSMVRVSNLEIGGMGSPEIRSSGAPLLLNPNVAQDVVVGSKLVVNTGAAITGDLSVTGSVTGASVIGARYQDLAEWVPSESDLDAGTVVVLSRDRANAVTAAASAYDTTVAGVVSEHPGIILGEGSDSKEMIATTGRVRVKVDATRHSIAIGDLLVSSDRRGHAMKSIPVDVAGAVIHRPGTIIGKALEPLASGEGEILVLLSLQ